ncbi:hypothetical protein ATL41_0514 [Flavimobilis soli]|uniref:Glycosyl transferase family 4 n=1 Tax=Flavimobilis soli TaxID=442709 RepID=A0A2A9E9S2_9MICO|nr:hypothetical protein [Flavimobilis soli]PFG35817.1 hypothetical protein ATL41_0514 [Flavimobilis soli]
MTRLRGSVAGVLAGVTARNLVRAALDEQMPGGTATWLRTNFRGTRVSLMGGPALASGLAAGALVGGAASRRARVGAAGAIAALAGGAAGLNDDLREDTEQRDKGLRGHLGALREGRVTTGAMKIAAIGAGAFVAATLVGKDRRRAQGTSAAAALGDLALDSVLVAGTANLVNLFDLRPGRALKVGLIGAAAVAVAGAPAQAAAVVGPAAASLPADLAELDMLGDSGANALGGVVGVGLTQASRRVRLAAAATVVGLTLASERVSFSRVIERTPVLSTLDAWGRRP